MSWWRSDRRQVRRSGRPVFENAGPRRRSRQPAASLLSPKRLPRALGRRWLPVIISTLLAVGLITGLVKLTTLRSIQVQGAHGISLQHIKNITSDGLDHQWFGHSLLLFNANHLKSHITTAEPAIKDLQLHRHFPHTLVVAITEREPGINWKSGGHLYLLDNDGKVIGDSHGEYTRLTVVSDSANLPVKVGDRVAPSSFVTFCSQLSALLEQSGIVVTNLQVPATTTEVYATAAKGYTIKFDTTRPPAGEVQDLQSVLAELSALHKTPTQYIDLRIEHKAYYK
jgi:cell division septal protein FtsQ